MHKRCIRHLCGYLPPVKLTSDADGGEVAITYADGEIEVWNVSDRRILVRTPAAGESVTPTLSRDGRYLAIAYLDYQSPSYNFVSVWNVAAGRNVANLHGAANTLAFSKGDSQLLIVSASLNRLYAVGLEGALHRHAGNQNERLPVLQANDPPDTDMAAVDAAAFDPATRSFTLAQVRVPSLTTPTRGEFEFVTWRPGGAAVATRTDSCNDGTVSADGSEFACLAFPPRLGGLGEIEVWNARSRREIAAWLPQSALGVSSVPDYGAIAFLDGGSKIAVEEDLAKGHFAQSRVLIFSVRDRVLRRTFDVPVKPQDITISAVGGAFVASVARPDAGVTWMVHASG